MFLANLSFLSTIVLKLHIRMLADIDTFASE